jgi:hypothetical protein
LSVVPVTPLGAVERIPAPDDLTAEQANIWRAVVNSEPADWFSPSTAPLLVQYCRHIVHASRLARWIERELENPDSTVESMEKLTAMEEKQSRIITVLATKMRLSQQSTINHRGNKKPTASKKLWE